MDSGGQVRRRHHGFSATKAARALCCGPSLVGVPEDVPEPDEVTTSGELVHGLLAQCASGLPPDGPGVESCGPTEKLLVCSGATLMLEWHDAGWDVVSVEMPYDGPEYQPLPGAARAIGEGTLTGGYPDVVFWKGSRAMVVDWKAGFRERRTLGYWQGWIYAGLVARAMAWAESVAVRIAYLRLGQSLVWLYSREEALAVFAHVERARRAYESGEPASFNPSDEWCSYCPRLSQPCPAVAREVERCVTLDPARLSAEQLSRVLDFRPTMRAFLDGCAGRAKRMLAADPLSVPGWSLSAKSGARIVDPAAAFHALVNGGLLTREEYWEAVEIPVGGLLEAVANRIHAGSRTRTKAEATSMAERILEEAGALSPGQPNMQLKRQGESDG